MAELIASTIFVISLGGILFILARKMPLLGQLPQNGTAGIKEHRIFREAEEKIKNIFVVFEKQIWLHKLLSFAKVILLKIETRVDHLLHSLRRKAKEKKEEENKK